MSAALKWQPLNYSSKKIPDLFLAARLDEEGYVIHISDLTRIWKHSLSRLELIQTANDSRCPINPGEDAEQYDILIKRLRAALDQQDGTSLQLSSHNDADTEDESSQSKLTLQLSANLPEPLPALKWSCDMQLLDDELTRSIILQPLVAEIQQQKAQIADLVEELASKDSLISRMLDVLYRKSGLDVNEVFQLNNRAMEKPSRSTLEQRVKGLKAFEQDSWLRRWMKRSVDKAQPDQIAAILAGAEDMSSDCEHKSGQWFKDVHLKLLTTGSEESETDDKIESSKTLAVSVADESSTTQHTFDTVPQKRKLGVIGGRKPSITTNAAAAASSIRPDAKAKLGTIGRKKTTSKEGNKDKVADETIESPPRQKRKIGAIGGSVKTEHTEPQVVAKNDTSGRKQTNLDKENDDSTNEAVQSPQQQGNSGMNGASSTDDHTQDIKQRTDQEQRATSKIKPDPKPDVQENKGEKPIKRKALIQASKKRVF